MTFREKQLQNALNDVLSLFSVECFAEQTEQGEILMRALQVRSGHTRDARDMVSFLRTKIVPGMDFEELAKELLVIDFSDH